MVGGRLLQAEVDFLGQQRTRRYRHIIATLREQAAATL